MQLAAYAKQLSGYLRDSKMQPRRVLML